LKEEYRSEETTNKNSASIVNPERFGWSKQLMYVITKKD